MLKLQMIVAGMMIQMTVADVVGKPILQWLVSLVICIISEDIGLLAIFLMIAEIFKSRILKKETKEYIMEKMDREKVVEINR
ncbi:hypothetical protein CEXT_193771 [Caerostris extrusa]|uniref:Uncharacterized protein n=1 Tax=Caerostris extrusa TaxID=172846 RepID=A0AAV4NIB9_CAEEX|nr:hypothetical protein CEXT_193771 [Caerostris extrusa]